jgi:hypothetical protein
MLADSIFRERAYLGSAKNGSPAQIRESRDQSVTIR